MVDYDEVEINRFTRTFTDPGLEEGYIEDRWEKNKRFIRTVVIAGHFLFYPILIDDVRQLGPGVSDVPVTYFIPFVLSFPITWMLILIKMIQRLVYQMLQVCSFLIEKQQKQD